MKELFSTDEWALISQAPYLVFRYIAGIDGKVDAKEIEAFHKFCKSRNSFTSKLLPEVLPANSESYLNSFESDHLTKVLVKDKLRTIDLYLDEKVDKADSISFKHHLIALGVYVANSSGKMFSAKISEEEDEILVQIGNYLDIDVSLLFKSTLVDEILKNVD